MTSNVTRSPGRKRCPDLRARPPRSVLLVRLSARGDVVFATPLIRAFKRSFPDVRLTWVVEPHTADLVRNDPLLDEVIVWDRASWRILLRRGSFLELWRRVRDFRALLRSHEFDLAFDLQGLLKSAAIAWISGARLRIGVGSRELSGVLMHHVFSDPGVSRVSSQYRELAVCLGLDTTDFGLQVHVSAEDARFARGWIEERELGAGYAALVPFTTWPEKHWFEDRWAGVAERVRDELGLTPVILGGPGDVEAAERIMSAVAGTVIDATGETSLGEASALVREAALVIGVDTGLNHVGVAFDRPTVSLFGPALPYQSMPSERGQILFHPLHCAPCWRKPTCGGEYTCMRLITEDAVMEAARRALSASASRPASAP